MLFASCSTQKKALRQVIKADVKHPTVVSGYCGTKYPPKFGKGETITKMVQGDIVYDTVAIHDTITNTITKYVFKTRVDTFYSKTIDTVENTAMIDRLASEIDNIEADYNDIKVELSGVKSSRNIWRNLFIGLATILALIFGIKFVIPKVLNRI